MIKKIRDKSIAGKVLLTVILAITLNLQSDASPGDTTWVTIYNLLKPTHYGNYDTTAIFPTGKTYRKIRAHYTLGRYACPSGTQYCGSWDYTTMLIAQPANKDSAEILRIITPYASDWLSQNKKHEYIIDVTDYASLLEGATAMRYRYEGYSWGFTVTLKLEFIEGTPALPAISVKKIYDGYFAFGNSANPIENHLVPRTFSYSPPVTRVMIKNSVTGHGSDATGCSEFCSKYYNLKINNNQVTHTQIWRNNCGLNEVSPQKGTWTYDRANWCPGAVVWPIYHDITPVTSANTTFTVDIDMEPYSTSTPSGGYNWVSQLIEYATPSHTRDVSLENITVPNNNENYVRENPACANPVIAIKNTGTDTVTEIVLTYGLLGGTPATYTWTGSLGFLEDSTLFFPTTPSAFVNTLTATFEVSVVSVNGITGDNDPLNNVYRSMAPASKFFPKDIVVKFFTNKSANMGTGFNESTWTLWDESGNEIASRDSSVNSTLYVDTLRDLPPGCYQFSIDDEGCDGLSYWANPNAGNGYLRFDYINANSTIYYFPGDFGCNTTVYFKVAETNLVGLPAGEIRNTIDIYPNPAQKSASLFIDLASRQEITYCITDISGRIIFGKQVNAATSVEMLDLKGLSAGVYFINVFLEDHSHIAKKLVVQD